MHRMEAHRRKLARAKQATRTVLARAHRAWQEHTRRLRDLAIAAFAAQNRIQQVGHRHVSLARHTPDRITILPRRTKSALAMRVSGGLPEPPRAQRAVQESTRRQRDQSNARHVPQTRIQKPSGPQAHQHAKIVRQAPALLQGAQSALAMRATKGLTEARAHRAMQEVTLRHRD
jgi:hypothetical protein